MQNDLGQTMTDHNLITNDGGNYTTPAPLRQPPRYINYEFNILIVQYSILMGECYVLKGRQTLRYDDSTVR